MKPEICKGYVHVLNRATGRTHVEKLGETTEREDPNLLYTEFPLDFIARKVGDSFWFGPFRSAFQAVMMLASAYDVCPQCWQTGECACEYVEDPESFSERTWRVLGYDESIGWKVLGWELKNGRVFSNVVCHMRGDDIQYAFRYEDLQEVRGRACPCCGQILREERS